MARALWRANEIFQIIFSTFEGGDFFWPPPPRKCQNFVQICQKFSDARRVRHTHRSYAIHPSFDAPGHVLCIHAILSALRLLLRSVRHEICTPLQWFWSEKVVFSTKLLHICCKSSKMTTFEPTIYKKERMFGVIHLSIRVAMLWKLH